MSSLSARIIQELRGLGADFFKELVSVYLKESGEKFPMLRASLDRRDAVELERTAHTLKGSSGNLGAESLSKLCAELQTVSRAKEWDRCAELVARIEREYSVTVADLRAEQEKT